MKEVKGGGGIEYAIMNTILDEIDRKMAEQQGQNDDNCQTEISISFIIYRHPNADPILDVSKPT
jgi:hypothetical protein